MVVETEGVQGGRWGRAMREMPRCLPHGRVRTEGGTKRGEGYRGGGGLRMLGRRSLSAGTGSGSYRGAMKSWCVRFEGGLAYMVDVLVCGTNDCYRL